MIQFAFIFLSSVITASGGSDVVLGVLGNTAFIECQVPISKTLIWLSGNGNIIAMNGNIINENSTKYLIETQNGLRESLVIHDLTLADDNIFRCYDINNKSFVDSTKLSVLVKPPIMKATVSPPQPMLEGSEVTLLCEADGGKPLPEIKWYRKSANGSVTEINGNVTDTTYANGTGHRINKLTIKVTRDMFQAKFACNITVSLLYQEAFIVNTDILLAPSKPTITSRHFDGGFDENSDLKLECVSNGGNTAPNIYWLIDGNRVGDVEVVVKPQTNGTSTVIAYFRRKVTRDYNGSVLTCAVTNKVLLDQGLPPRASNITLLASYKPNATTEQDEYLTRLGENVTFKCFIDGNPLPRFDQLYWTHKGAMIDRNYYSLSNRSDIFSLTLDNVAISDAGYYACHAVNRLGAATSSQVKLSVLYAPICEFSSVQKVAVRIGENAKLSCRMKTSPNDVMFTWRYKHNDERIRRVLGIQDMPGSDLMHGELDLTVGSQIRYGEIECYGNNTEGESDKPCLFDIVPPGPPEIPVNCSTTVNNSDVQINCKAGFNGGSTQHFILQKLGKFEYETLLSADNPSFQFQTYENVTIRICAFNDDFKNIKNCAIPSAIIVFVQGIPDDRPSKGKKSDETAYIAGGVVAAIGVIIIAIIIAALLFRRHKKGKTSRNINDLESVSKNREAKSNKFERWWRAVSLKQFSGFFRKAEQNKSTPSSIRKRETVTDTDDNDTPSQDFVRLSSTPYHPYKAYRIERNLNCSIFNERLEEAIKDDRHVAPDVLNENTGFALSPIASRNNEVTRNSKHESSFSNLDIVVETSNHEKQSNETTDFGISNFYNTADMTNILTKIDTVHELKEIETADALGAKTLNKDYTDGDIADVLDSSDKFDLQLQIKDETNEMEIDSFHDGCDDQIAESKHETFDDSVSILKFMNVDFSAVAPDDEEASKVNHVSEESLTRRSDDSKLKCTLMCSPAPEISTEISFALPGRIAKANSLPYRSRKHKQHNLKKVNSLSNLEGNNKLSLITKPAFEHFTKCNRSMKTNPNENFSSDQNSYTIAVDNENTISDATLSSRTSDVADMIHDIDEFTLTITSDTTELDCKCDFENLHNDSIDVTCNTPRIESATSNTSFDIDKFTLTLTSESELDSANFEDISRESIHENKDMLHNWNGQLHDSLNENNNGQAGSIRDLVLRRNSFMEAIRHTQEDCNFLENSRPLGTTDNTSIVIDSETEGSYFNYGYEKEIDSKSSSEVENECGEEPADTDNVNVVAYF